MEQSGQLGRPITCRSRGSNPVPAIEVGMEKKEMIVGAVIFVIVGAVLFYPFVVEMFDVEEVLPEGDVVTSEAMGVSSVVVPEKKVAPNSAAVNFQTYNIDYMNDNVKAILVRQAGANGKTAFYLPSTGYINVSKGTNFGVAHLIKNVNPKVPEGSNFEFNFNADASVTSGCGVSVVEAQSWIERGQSSSGMISGQWREDWNEWHDAMTIYFAFPSDVQSPCNVKYNYKITKDGQVYDSRQLEFNVN